MRAAVAEVCLHFLKVSGSYLVRRQLSVLPKSADWNYQVDPSTTFEPLIAEFIVHL